MNNKWCSFSCKEDDQYKEKKMTNLTKTRPNAANGYWLSCLLPLSFAVSYVKPDKSSNCNNQMPSTYDTLTIAAIGMCIESISFFVINSLQKKIPLKILISLVPGLITSSLFRLLQSITWSYSIFLGFIITIFYQNTYLRIMQLLPLSFTFGEAAVIVQGVTIFTFNMILQLWAILSGSLEEGGFAEINAIMLCSLTYLLIGCWLLLLFENLRKPVPFYLLLTVLLAAVTCMPIKQKLPIVRLFDFILRDISRIYTVIFYTCLTILTFLAVHTQSRQASTRTRKIFHVLMILVYVPGILYQCAFLYLASGVALAIMIILELLRVLNIPPLANKLKEAFALFLDEKDAGLIALTPFCLLIGCSLPIWISPCPCTVQSDWKLLSNMSGILAIGFGDTAASVFGSMYGRIHWRNSSRTLEGTIAFIIAVLCAIFCFHLSAFITMTTKSWIVSIAATVITAFFEAYTNQIDNLILPLIFYVIIHFC